MPWITTYSGTKFPLFNPAPDDVKIIDIARSLSMQCRFNGHVRRFYSVAEHSLVLSYLVSPAAAKAALLHDAPEAYIGDMVSPLKKTMVQYKNLDNALLRKIFDRYDVPYDEEIMAEVHAADTWIAYKEARALFPNPSTVDAWAPPPEFKPLLSFDFASIGLSSPIAEMGFRDRFLQLFGRPE